MFLSLAHVAHGQKGAEISFQEQFKKAKENKRDTMQVGIYLKVAHHYVERIMAAPAALDSALLFSGKASTLSAQLKYDSGIVRSIQTEAEAWIEARDAKLSLSERGLPELTKAKDAEQRIATILKAESHAIWLGKIYVALAERSKQYDRETLPEKLRLYESAIKLFQRAKASKDEATAIYYVGFAYHGNGELDKAEQKYLQVIEIINNCACDGLLLQQAYGILGNVYNYQGKLNMALKFQLQALRMAELNEDSTEYLGAVHLFLGNTYGKLKNEEKETFHYEHRVSYTSGSSYESTSGN